MARRTQGKKVVVQFSVPPLSSGYLQGLISISDRGESDKMRRKKW